MRRSRSYVPKYRGFTRMILLDAVINAVDLTPADRYEMRSLGNNFWTLDNFMVKGLYQFLAQNAMMIYNM